MDKEIELLCRDPYTAYSAQDYLDLAERYERITEDYIHPSVYEMRHKIADTLRKISSDPFNPQCQTKYATFRFLMPNMY